MTPIRSRNEKVKRETARIKELEAEPATAIELWNAGKPMEEIANVLERKAQEYFIKQSKKGE